ncbi:MAG: hypothetical protein J6S42_03145, partial [Thermoguttaceae bacterium]|nr:hypothetical protein [Thermoguttaceae bacterium]
KSVSMYPMDFEEFCFACGEEGLLSYVRDCFNKLSPLEDSIHRKAMLPQDLPAQALPAQALRSLRSGLCSGL